MPEQFHEDEADERHAFGYGAPSLREMWPFLSRAAPPPTEGDDICTCGHMESQHPGDCCTECECGWFTAAQPSEGCDTD